MGGDNIWNTITGNYDKIGGGYAPTTTATTDEILNQYLKYMPELNELLSKQTVQAAQLQTPALNQLQLEQMQKYGVPLAKAGNAITAENAQAGANINKSLLQGTGAEAARAASTLDKEINPTLYQSRQRAGDLLSSINLNGLSGGERAEVERSLNKDNIATGNLGVNNMTNAVSNAMRYGDRMTQKRQELNQYVNTGLNASQGGVNGVGVALGGTQAPQTNFGTSQFQTPGAATSGAQTLGTSLLGNLTQVGASTIAPQAESAWKGSDRYAMDQIGANM